ncbi:MAG: penicillin acylase family protein [Bryobacter sp.]|nr:penicillin acylase family protein [Bryobacter sp.]
MKLVLLALVLVTHLLAIDPTPEERKRWENTAGKVQITRDDWGIAHIRGKSDADAVFGMIYAQAEDDFPRVELNYLNAMGRLAEAEGEEKVFQDLRMKMWIDPVELQAMYRTAPEWLKKLMQAWADGLNFYLYRHPETKPRVIARFEPWMALSFTEGSIGGDIESIRVPGLEAFYGQKQTAHAEREDWLKEPSGSNGISIAPKLTKNGRALLLINPHTTFYFRSEQQMTSEEGLNAYGAATWGQFFIYQGFNESAGWMHTSSGADVIDEFAETVVKKADGVYYRYGKEERKFRTKEIRVPYRTEGGMREKQFTVYYSHRGPVVREEGGKWVSVQLMNSPVKALTQSYLRTKAKDLASYRKTMETKTNSSNNTLFADRKGNVAYFHGNFMPRRNDRFDYTKPVDGADPAVDWQGLHDLKELPSTENPSTGWLYNANDWPWASAGAASPKRESFPKYVENGLASARGRHAVEVLEGKKDFDLEGLLRAAYDAHLPWFEKALPALERAWAKEADAARKAKLAGAVEALAKWDRRWAESSVETALGVFWGSALLPQIGAAARAARMPSEDYVAQMAEAGVLLVALEEAMAKLEADFGTWKKPWGEINRFQRLNEKIASEFDDVAESLAVPFTSGIWGSLASFGARAYPNTKKWYGTSGNSFVAVVEFGPRVRALALSAGGQSGKPDSKHFRDQAGRYPKGALRPVYFYAEDLRGHTERVYKPGE